MVKKIVSADNKCLEAEELLLLDFLLTHLFSCTVMVFTNKLVIFSFLITILSFMSSSPNKTL